MLSPRDRIGYQDFTYGYPTSGKGGLDVNKPHALVAENLALLDQVAPIISQLTDAVYTNNESPYFISGIGRHLRHILDFYHNLVNSNGRRIDYDNRPRSRRIETERAAAFQRIDAIRSALTMLKISDNPILIKNDDGGHRDKKEGFSPSTIGRELQFLASHTVHHYAIMAMILRLQDIHPPADFGIAPSTLRHMREGQAGRQ
jgi:uncharacterized damage-inducible protein DinB